MNFAEAFGAVAGGIMVVAYLPQIKRLHKLKKADEISLTLFGMIGAGIIMWIGYGIFVKDYTIIIMNTLLLTANLTVVSMKILYDRKNKDRDKINHLQPL